ncbi:MAG: PKD domain-containing protein [Bacteroidota bacterium]
MKKPFVWLLLFILLIWGGVMWITADPKEEQLFISTPNPELSDLRFIKNQGQWPARALFKVRLVHGNLWMEDNQWAWVLDEPIPVDDHGHAHVDSGTVIEGQMFYMRFEGANPQPQVVPEHKFSTYHNYYQGNNPSKWASKVPLYGIINYQSLYPGVDLKVYGDIDHLKYDFEVAVGADPAQIRIAYEGLEKIELKNGQLHLDARIHKIVEEAPIAYQWINDQQVPVKCEYALKGKVLSYHFPEGYRKDLPLVIDPTLIFSSFTGSFSDNWGYTATYDDDGNAYAGGTINTISSTGNTDGYPTTPGALQTTFSGGGSDITLSKFNPMGTDLVYSTYIGGELEEQPHSLVVNSNNELILMGRTNSDQIPIAGNPFRGFKSSGFDLYLAKFAADGSLLVATYFGGSGADGSNGTPDPDNYSSTKYNYGDDARGEVIVNDNNEIFVAAPTQSINVLHVNPIQPILEGSQDGMVIKFTEDLSSVVWSTYLGGSGVDAVHGIKIDPNGDVWVVGGTNSVDMPVTNGVIQSSYGGGVDGFLGKIAGDGSQIIALSYVGTNRYDQAYLIDLDKDGDVYIAGQSEGNMPIVNPPAGAVYRHAGAKQFVRKYNSELTQIMYSTNIGSVNAVRPNLSPTAMLVDVCEEVYIAGWGGVTNQFGSVAGMETTADALQDQTDANDLYLFVLSKDAQSLDYATYLGGLNSTSTVGEHVDGGTSRFDKNGIVYHAVCASCINSAPFPTFPQGVYSENSNGPNCNLAIFKLAFDLEGIRADFRITNQMDTIVGCAPFVANFDNRSFEGTSPGQVQYDWDFGDGSGSSNIRDPQYIFNDGGFYEVRLIITDSLSCNISDTAYRYLRIVDPPEVDAGDDVSICPGETRFLNGAGEGTYRWSPVGSVSDPSIPNPEININTTTTFTLTAVDEFGCVNRDDVTVSVLTPRPVEAGLDRTVCVDEVVQLRARAPQGGIISYAWEPSADVTPPNIPDPIVIPNQTTTYVLTAVDDQGCNSIDSVTISTFALEQTVIQVDNRSCIGEGIILTIVSNADQFVWSTGDTTQTISFQTPVDPRWIVGAGINRGCAAFPDSVFLSDTLDVPVADFLPSADTAYAPALIEFQNTSQNASDFIWRFGNDRTSTEVDPEFGYVDPGIYLVTLEAYSGSSCGDTITKVLFIDEVLIFVPSAFTPNSDNFNQNFRVYTKNMASYRIDIFSRWGMKIYSSENPEAPWDGTYQGQNVPEGVYVYLIQATGRNGRPYKEKGTITLIR